jgi:predicted kinase
MGRPTLYLMIGYPGAGKTTVARIIHDATGAVHLWSDIERHKLFGRPTHSHEESRKLYDELNARTEALLAEGKSVIFDTSFNFLEDRRKLQAIAGKHGAETMAVWVDIPEPKARHRAVDRGVKRNGYHTRMTDEEFDRVTAKLEPPAKDEKFIKIDGMKLDKQTVLAILGQHDAHVSSS